MQTEDHIAYYLSVLKPDRALPQVDDIPLIQLAQTTALLEIARELKRAAAAQGMGTRRRKALSEPLYYIQNTGCCGNCLRWWRVEGRGYTMNLDDAWQVTAAKALDICRARPKEDIPYPVAEIDQLAVRHVNAEDLWQSQRDAASAQSKDRVVREMPLREGAK